MRRREVLIGASVAAGTAMSFPAPMIAQGVRRLTMVTDWPETMPGLLPSAQRLAQMIGDATSGRIKIEVFSAGAMVRPFETFDAVQAGVADMFQSFVGYFEKKSPALHFYAAIPFGFTANELFAWVRYGGGQELWDALSRQFNVKPLLSMSTGTQMGGWFNNPIASLAGFKGLRYRMAGPGAEVLRRLGAIVVVLPGGEIAPSLKSGAIDACEWIGPWLDHAMGLHEVAAYYYFPAWHEPGTAQTLGINTRVWETLTVSEQRAIEGCAAAEYTYSLAEFNSNNAESLRKLRKDGVVRILKFDDSVLKGLLEISKGVVAEIGSGDELSKKIYASYQQFRGRIADWSDISEHAYLNSRGLG